MYDIIVKYTKGDQSIKSERIHINNSMLVRFVQGLKYFGIELFAQDRTAEDLKKVQLNKQVYELEQIINK